MVKDLVSIIIPVYNAEPYLAETLQSALRQSWTNIEIIVVDDGSTDRSLAIARSFESNKLRVFSQMNKGASAARNYGIRHASGSYIQFLDGDDLLSSNKIEEQLKEIAGTDEIAFCPNRTMYGKNIVEEGDKWYMTDFTATEKFLLTLYGGESSATEYGGMITVHSWLTPRHIIERAGFWDETLTVDDDGEFFCRVVLSASAVRFCEGCFTVYRKSTRNEISLSSQQSESSLWSAFQALNLKLACFEADGENADARKVFAKHFWQLRVKSYPHYKNLSMECMKRYQTLAANRSRPKLYIGGALIDFIANNISWKLARTLQTIKHQLSVNLK